MEGRGDVTSKGQRNSSSIPRASAGPAVLKHGGGDIDRPKRETQNPETLRNEILEPWDSTAEEEEECREVDGECEVPGEDLWSPEANFYVSTGGDIINEGALSDPETIESATTIPDDLDLPEDDDFREWTELDPSDDEEQEELREKYFDLFKVAEPEEVLFGEDDLSPEDAGYWKEYFARQFTNQHVNVHQPEKFLKLNLHHDRVTDVSFIPQHFPALKFLDVSKNFVQNVRSLGKLKNLVHLNASDNEITRFLDICTKVPHPLQEVDLSKNQITEIVRFDRFLALVNVNLAYNHLRTVKNFQHCYFLRFLNLSHNAISEIPNLDCPNLLVLLLQDNKLESISGLVKCKELRYLNISKNRVSDLSPLQMMPQLVQLRAANNCIGLKEIDVLKCLIYMSHLRITPNPCTSVEFSRQMLIFTLPQIRYLDKQLVLPQEIVEANNIFKPTFEKMAFEDHRNTMLEKATQSGTMMFNEFSEMFPLPPMLFLVGSSRSRAEDLAMSLKQKFRCRILLGGVHSTATTIESGNHHDDIPISLENFIEMKKRGHLFSTSTVLGRLCGFSATQFIKAVEHEAVLVAISIPLETAICLRKWGFKATTILVIPSEAPHFNVDAFIAKEKRRQSLHIEEKEPPPKLHEHLISFQGDRPLHRAIPQRSHRQSILKHQEIQLPAPSITSMVHSQLSPTASSMGFDISKIQSSTMVLHQDKVDEISEAEDAEVGQEWLGEDFGQLTTETVVQATDESLTLFGVEIINPATIPGIDWKRTVLGSDFYEAILAMDEDFHFLVTRSSEDASIVLTRELVETTISALGYILVHGPTPVYIKVDDPENPAAQSTITNFQLIVVKERPSSDTTAVDSCLDLSKPKVPAHASMPFILCEDDGEGGEGYFPSYMRPASPWYHRITGSGEDILEEDYDGYVMSIKESEHEIAEGAGDHLNKFKHRDALEFAILRTREEYLKYHLDNPGFFTTVLDTRDLEKSQTILEEIVQKMLTNFEQDGTNSKLYPLVESYAQIVPNENCQKFIDERLRLLDCGDNTERTGFSSCPMNLFCTNISKGCGRGRICQLQRAEALRKKMEKEKDELNAGARRVFKTCPELPVEVWPGEEPGEIECLGETCLKACQCGEECNCEPPTRRRRSYDNFRSSAVLSEFGYDGDA